jgi:ABC-type nickel/cobalt efflux system permease component RcnA
MLLLFFGIAFMVDKRLWLRNASFLSFLLLSQTTIYGVFILVGVLFYKFSREFPKNKKQSLYEILMATVLIVFSAWQVWEPSDEIVLRKIGSWR